MFELAANVGATIAVALACWVAYPRIRELELYWTSPNDAIGRRRIRKAKMLPAHWVGAALAVLALVGVWL